MREFSEILLASFLLTDIILAGTGRLRQAIRLVALQGWAVGLLPLVMWNWTESGVPGISVFAVAAVNALIKGCALPWLLSYTVRKVDARPELEPLVGFRASRIVVFAFAVASFAAARPLGASAIPGAELAIPVALATMGTGLFLVCARRKAVTQVLGFIVFENGIAAFGSGFMMEIGIIVELGILLDVFVLVFLLGIAIFQISRTFSSLDTDQLSTLGDVHLMHIRKSGETGGRK